MPFNCTVIKNGPGLHLLFSQLHDIGRFASDRMRPTVRFEIFDLTEMDDSEWVDLHVNGIQAEDGSGDWWKLQGFVANVGPGLQRPLLYGSAHERVVRIDFTATYGLRMKEGEFHFEPVPE